MLQSQARRGRTSNFGLPSYTWATIVKSSNSGYRSRVSGSKGLAKPSQCRTEVLRDAPPLGV